MQENKTPEVNDEADVEAAHSFLDNPPVWFCISLWTLPIWWTYLLVLILGCLNSATTSAGHPLYELIPGAKLYLLWAIVPLFVLVATGSLTKYFKARGIYILVIWFFLFTLSGATPFGFSTALQRAAGKPFNGGGISR